MKFVHIADVHLDAPFSELSNKENLGDIRRLEQRSAFKKVIEYVQKNDIEYLFIAGDLYEHEYAKKTSIDFVNNLFEEIKNTKIFIIPGNHDPYIKGSYYDTYDWSENVHICRKEIEVVHENDFDIYMTAFTDSYMDKSIIENIKIENNDRLNILLTHCDLNGSKDENRSFL